MTRTTLLLSACFAALLTALLAASAFAQDGSPMPAPNTGDYRWAIYTSCSVVFVAIGIYLITTHGRAAAAARELGILERRLDELESGSAQ